jgi:hypothetical protein
MTVQHVLADDVTPTTQAEAILAAIVKEDNDKAYKLIFDGASLSKKSKCATAASFLKGEGRNVVNTFGRITGYELVAKKSIR